MFTFTGYDPNTQRRHYTGLLRSVVPVGNKSTHLYERLQTVHETEMWLIGLSAEECDSVLKAS
ncbi:hypothetical protein E3U43_012992 [Larimichthys crocea]|uniref:Uncharacterized protein n=1 Tax=Larimichthys crocea TaxID=215358 RepID=A0ACD3RTP9_LARCR|nr:hypothetical protein E3U43_012992 [Larimichthys crocea]